VSTVYYKNISKSDNSPIFWLLGRYLPPEKSKEKYLTSIIQTIHKQTGEQGSFCRQDCYILSGLMPIGIGTGYSQSTGRRTHSQSCLFTGHIGNSTQSGRGNTQVKGNPSPISSKATCWPTPTWTSVVGAMANPLITIELVQSRFPTVSWLPQSLCPGDRYKQAGWWNRAGTGYSRYTIGNTAIPTDGCKLYRGLICPDFITSSKGIGNQGQIRRNRTIAPS
jgi:hypothetical protein